MSGSERMEELDKREEAIKEQEAELQKKWDALNGATEFQVKELKELSEELDVKKLRRRLHQKSQELDKKKILVNQLRLLKTEEGAKDLYNECNRLMQECIKMNADKQKAEEALAIVCARYNLDPILDFYQGIPIWATTGETIEIPEGGMVIDFLDEEVIVTRDHFGGMSLIHFDLFASTVNDKLKPERWRIGLQDRAVTLFARGLYKVTDIPLMDPPKESETEVKIEPLKEHVEDVG